MLETSSRKLIRSVVYSIFSALTCAVFVVCALSVIGVHDLGYICVVIWRSFLSWLARGCLFGDLYCYALYFGNIHTTFGFLVNVVVFVSSARWNFCSFSLVEFLYL